LAIVLQKNYVDLTFSSLTAITSVSVIMFVLGVLPVLLKESAPAIEKFCVINFLPSTTGNPVTGVFGTATGILTGILFSIARVAGEITPLLLTSFNNNFFSGSTGTPLASLTVTIFRNTMGHFKSWHTPMWGTCFVITLCILARTLSDRLIIHWRYKR